MENIIAGKTYHIFDNITERDLESTAIIRPVRAAAVIVSAIATTMLFFAITKSWVCAVLAAVMMLHITDIIFVIYAKSRIDEQLPQVRKAPPGAYDLYDTLRRSLACDFIDLGFLAVLCWTALI